MKLTFLRSRYGSVAVFALTLTACGGTSGGGGTNEDDAGADAAAMSPSDAGDDASWAADATLDSQAPADANGDGATPLDAADDGLTSADASDAGGPDGTAADASDGLPDADEAVDGSDDAAADATDDASFDASTPDTGAPDAGPACDAGFLDPTFGTCGVFSTAGLAPLLGTNATGVLVRAMVAQDTGNIVLAGDYATFAGVGEITGGTPFVTRVLADGSGLDPSFGSGGVVPLPAYGGGPYVGEGLVQQGDGKLLVSALCPTIVPGKTFPDVCVTRLGADGAVDPTYGSGGVAHVSFSSTDLQGGAVESLDAQGRALMIGWTETSSTDTSFLVRLTTTGALDPAFNGGAPVVVAQASIDDGAAVTSVAALPSGGILVAGGPELGSPNLHLAVLTSSGAPDDTIDPDGGASANVVPFPAAFEPSTLVTGPDGTVYAFGGTYAAASPSLATIAKVTATGAVDDTFGTGGEAFLASGEDYSGTIIEGSSFYANTFGTVYKLGLDGTPVTAWGSGGSVPVNWGPGGYVWSPWVMVASPRGPIASGSNEQTVYLARLLP